MKFSLTNPTLIGLILVGSLGAPSCQTRPAPPEPEPAVPATPQPMTSVSSAAATTATAQTATADPAASASGSAAPTTVLTTPPGSSSAPVAQAVGSAALSAKSPEAAPSAPPGTDPAQGRFTLEEAVKGLPKAGKLFAEIQTDAGKLKCELFEDKAPLTVANFVGLARGLRPFKDPKTREWVKRPAYDDGVFHRIIRGFMIQGGDPTGTGAGDGGYVFDDEVWPGATHDRRGLLCMANRGKNTNSMQFFIMDGPALHLNGGYTIFGQCGPDATIEKLAASEVHGDRAANPPKIKKVTIKRSK